MIRRPGLRLRPDAVSVEVYAGLHRLGEVRFATREAAQLLHHFAERSG